MRCSRDSMACELYDERPPSVGEEFGVRDDRDHRVARIEPARQLAVGDQEDPPQPGREAVQRPQRIPQLVAVVVARGVRGDRMQRAVGGAERQRLPPQPLWVGAVHPGVDGVDREADPVRRRGRPGPGGCRRCGRRPRARSGSSAPLPPGPAAPGRAPRRRPRCAEERGPCLRAGSRTRSRTRTGRRGPHPRGRRSPGSRPGSPRSGPCPAGPDGAAPARPGRPRPRAPARNGSGVVPPAGGRRGPRRCYAGDRRYGCSGIRCRRCAARW